MCVVSDRGLFDMGNIHHFAVVRKLVVSVMACCVNVSVHAETVENFLERTQQSDSVLYGVFYDYRSYLDTYCNHEATMEDLARFGASQHSLRLLNIMSDSPNDDKAYMAALTSVPCPGHVAEDEQPIKDPNRPVSDLDGERLLYAFVLSYNGGDVSQMMPLFAADAMANHRDGVADIEKEYRDLFNDTDLRQMVVQDVRWTLNGNGGKGRGKYQVTILPKTERSPKYYEGSIELEFIKNDAGLFITRLNHQPKDTQAMK